MIYENRIGQKHKYNSESKSNEMQNYWSSTLIPQKAIDMWITCGKVPASYICTCTTYRMTSRNQHYSSHNRTSTSWLYTLRRDFYER
eukprot:3562451-Amphidinium_carterae.1